MKEEGYLENSEACLKAKRNKARVMMKPCDFMIIYRNNKQNKEKIRTSLKVSFWSKSEWWE